MSHKLLQIDFPTEGPFGADMSAGFDALAQDIATESGLIWKIWTENAATKEAGGVYLFADLASLERYLSMHTERLTSFGVTGIRSKIFDVNEPLSALTHFTLNQ
ncbi:MAG: monooxygenase [Neisseriaceae bacterium]|nr:monooxygenase [Neisseriaceae bacterium]MBP6863108.1 monooxygenase [Neisseriaceae bacterium]